jgi:hypothetical protein
MSTPTPCYRIEAQLSAAGDSLALSVTATALPRICIEVLAAYDYEARIAGLSPGSYEVAVSHSYPNTGWQPRIHRVRLEVP